VATAAVAGSGDSWKAQDWPRAGRRKHRKVREALYADAVECIFPVGLEATTDILDNVVLADLMESTLSRAPVPLRDARDRRKRGAFLCQ